MSASESNSAIVLELAEELSTTVGAVYNLHYRANQLLRECLQKEFA